MKYADFTLLVDGKNAFPEILSCIENAQKALVINMFIWRDDEIGNRLAEAVLRAADRGVQVTLSIDRYGVVLEKAEECKKSFFHKKLTLTERIKIAALKGFYPMPGAPKRAKDECTPLYERIANHPNITLDTDRFKADHSKFYIIDGEILILGGINVEDKENGEDMQGRAYQDYMVKIVGKAHVDAFLEKRKTGWDIAEDYTFGLNLKEGKNRRFEMEELYLQMINSAKEKLYITMAYFSPLKPFMQAIIKAWKRGVEIVIMIPRRANFQDDTNRKTVKKLLKATENGVTVYFSPKMVHTKMVINDGYISFGSTNITKKAFCQLDELNLFVQNEPCDFQQKLLISVRENYEISEKITDYKQIKYNKLRAFFEGMLV